MNRIFFVAVILVALGAGWFATRGDRARLELVENTAAEAGVKEMTTQGGLTALDEVAQEERAVAAIEVAATEPAPAMASPSEPALGALHVSVQWSDGFPAPGVGVVLKRRPAKSGVTRRLRRSTGGDGVARFEDLSAGEYSVFTLRTKEDTGPKVLVTEAEVAHLDLELPAGHEVVGRVTNSDGVALPGAEIWLEGLPGGWASGEVVALTDRSGEYRLRDLPASPSLAALAAGYAPSVLMDLDLADKSSHPIRMDFVVTPGGGSLEGVVTDAEGLPVDGAVVAAGAHDGTYDVRFDDTVAETWTFRHTTTDAQGRYRFGTLPIGELPVAIREPGYAPWSGSVEIERLSTLRHDVRLDSGAAVSGRVVDSAGDPVEGARVQAFHAPLSETFLQGGQIDFDGPFGQPCAVTAKGGRYTLGRLPHRPVFLYALAPRPKRRSMEDIVQFTRGKVDLSDGGEHTWNPTLSDGAAIVGTVRYRDGAPIENIFVNIRATEGSDASRRATHTPSGSFKFIQLPGTAYTVRAQIWELPEGSKEPYLADVVPGGEPIELVADFDAPAEHASSTVTIRFSDEANRTMGSGVSLSLENQARYSWQLGDRDAEGVWSFELNQPGRFRPIALLGERLIAVGDVFEFTPGEDLDLGVLRSEPGGTLVLHLTTSEEHPPTGWKGTVAFGGFRHREDLPPGAASPVRLEGVEPGPGTVSFYGDNILMESFEFEISAGEETVLDVELSPAVAVPYRIDLPNFEGDMSLQLRFVDIADGSDAGRSEFKDLSRYPKRIEFKKRLGLGSYRFEVELSDGRRKVDEFTVHSLDPGEAPRPAVDLR